MLRGCLCSRKDFVKGSQRTHHAKPHIIQLPKPAGQQGAPREGTLIPSQPASRVWRSVTSLVGGVACVRGHELPRAIKEDPFRQLALEAPQCSSRHDLKAAVMKREGGLVSRFHLGTCC